MKHSKVTRMMLLALACAVLAASAWAQVTKTEKSKGASEVTTRELKGTVVHVEGNSLVVKMSTGEVREFKPPADRKFMIDGQELSVGELKPGTKLTATITTTTTPVLTRTTTMRSGGKVFYVSAPTLIVHWPDGETKQYKVAADYKFMVNGRPASVFELKKGMIVSGEKIVEEPSSEIAANTVVTGQAPPPPQPKAEVAQAPRRAAPAPAAAPTPAAQPEPARQAEQMPAKLPKTASSLPLAGLLGMLFLTLGLGLGAIRRLGC